MHILDTQWGEGIHDVDRIIQDLHVGIEGLFCQSNATLILRDGDHPLPLQTR